MARPDPFALDLCGQPGPVPGLANALSILDSFQAVVDAAELHAVVNPDPRGLSHRPGAQMQRHRGAEIQAQRVS